MLPGELPGDQEPWGSPEVQGPSHHPGQERGSRGSPIPEHHCGCRSWGAWGKGFHAPLRGHHRGYGGLSSLSEMCVQDLVWGCKPGLCWHLFQTLLWPVCALRMIFLLYLTSMQIKLFSGTAGETPSLRRAWIKHMSWHSTNQPVGLIDFPSMSYRKSTKNTFLIIY